MNEEEKKDLMKNAIEGNDTLKKIINNLEELKKEEIEKKVED